MLTPLRARLEVALAELGFSAAVQEASETFVRLVVGDGDDETFVDLASDFRLRPAAETPYGPVLSVDELAADKLLALFSRAEARDFVDTDRVSDLGGLEPLTSTVRNARQARRLSDSAWDRTVDRVQAHAGVDRRVRPAVAPARRTR